MGERELRGGMVYVRQSAIASLDGVRGETLSDRIVGMVAERDEAVARADRLAADLETAHRGQLAALRERLEVDAERDRLAAEVERLKGLDEGQEWERAELWRGKANDLAEENKRLRMALRIAMRHFNRTGSPDAKEDAARIAALATSRLPCVERITLGHRDPVTHTAQLCLSRVLHVESARTVEFVAEVVRALGELRGGNPVDP